MATTDELVLLMAAAKFVKDEATAIEKNAKDQLIDQMAPGDRKIALAPDGTEVATISRARFTRKNVLSVTNEPALIRWLKAHHDGEGVQTVETVAEWKVADLMREIEESGELPDGVEINEKTSGGYVSARQTDDHKANIIENRAGLMGLIDDYRKELEQ